MKEHATRIRKQVSSLLHPALGWAKRAGDRVGFWDYKKPDEDTSRFGEKEFQCPECRKVMHIGVKEDHLESHEETEEDITEKNTVSSSNKVHLSDYVDDYEIDWERKEEEEPGIDIQEATGGTKLKKKQLREKWKPYIKQLRQTGEVRISSNQHHGGLRGAHIVQRMKSDFKRLDLEMSLEFDIGESQSYVRVDNI